MYTIAALYHFVRFQNHTELREPLLKICRSNNIGGTLLLAQEGINGTIAGTRRDLDTVLAYIKSLPGCSNLEHKESKSSTAPFNRMKVRLKKEIVTMGQPDVDPIAGTGHYVDPKEWNDLISRPDVVTIDTRNDYEVAIGTFDGAIDPETKSFGEFPQWWADNKDRFHNKKIAMFCTGGIRCEKSTNFLLNQGIDDVYHLKGGILKYLEEVPEEQSSWNGDCFVFDARVSVRHALKEGPHSLCYACRRPLHPDDMSKSEYEKGISCHQCINDTSGDDKQRFRERQKQIALSSKRGTKHMGSL